MERGPAPHASRKSGHLYPPNFSELLCLFATQLARPMSRTLPSKHFRGQPMNSIGYVGEHGAK
ncbi:hypothetical protein NMD1_00627 [Novosphingobium sp. MD-1]|nr:hypothetical protein NMD1_00627 [Novosphingobium sp. MD-1]